MSYDPDHRISCFKQGCYATINLSPKDYQRLKRTGESFWCPAGHSQHFTGKTDEQKRIDALERTLHDLEREYGTLHGHRELLIALIRRCPICAATPGRHVRVYRDNWRFENDLANVRDWMAEHLQTEHAVVSAREEHAG